MTKRLIGGHGSAMILHVVSIGVALLIVSGCGPRAASDAPSSGGAAPHGASNTRPAAPPAAPRESPVGAPAPGAGTTLEIEVWPAGERKGERIEYTLTCAPAGGTHPDPVEACGSLEKLGAKAFAPVPADRMCTQQYGGPMQARVRGVAGGQKVDARLAYTDGCQISRWNRLAAVVPVPRGTVR